MTRTQAYWLCQLAGWTLIGGISQAVHPENWAPGEIQTTLLSWVLGTAVAIGLTHTFRIYAKRHGWTRLPIKRLIPRGLAASVLLGVLSEGIRAGLIASDLLRMTADDRANPSSATTVVGDMTIMGAWIAIYFGVHAAWNYRQAEINRWRLQAQAEAARLEALKLQLNPHFFFNSLSSIRSLISEAPGRAKKMVARLARLLRQALQSGDETTVPLREELSTTETYLGLEKVRFEDRLEWEIDATEAALDQPVPFMLLQTLTENAVKHGIGRCQDGGTVSIEADVADGLDAENEGLLHLRVTNPGQLGDDDSAWESGTGLENARERLRLLFGDDASLELRQSEPETVTATALIPQQASAQQGEASRGASQRARDMAKKRRGEQAESSPTDTSEGSPHAGSFEDQPQPRTPMGQPSSSSSGTASTGQDSGSIFRFWGGSLAYWLCQIVGWGSLAVFGTLASDQTWGQSWSGIIEELASAIGILGGLGIGITHAFRAYAKKHGWTDLPPRRLAPRAGAAAVLLGGTYILILSPMILSPEDVPTAWGPWLWAVLGEVAAPIFGFSVVMGVWLAIYFGVHAVWNYRQAEIDRWRLQAQSEAARLEALKLQLNPHFFFNCLSSVRALISEAPGRTKTMIARLARLLRRTLQAGDEKTVPLEEEFSTTETYLQLENVRFGDRLDWETDAGEAALGHEVPFMLVQTLVENAVKHGIGQRRGGGTIQIGADATADDTLRLQVTNPGELDDGSAQGSGTGLENARERLELLFGDEASLDLHQSGPETVTATAWIPRPAALEDRIVGDEAPSREPDRAPAEGILAGASGP